MSWVEAYENAAMILSGMGPAKEITTQGGKIFAGSYALFSGIFFLIVIGVIIAPVFHRFFHKFIINQYPTKNAKVRDRPQGDLSMNLCYILPKRTKIIMMINTNPSPPKG